MEYHIASQDVTYQYYPIDYPLAWSSHETIDINDLVDTLSSAWMKQKRFRLWQLQSLLYLLEIDFSSIRPRFETKSETFSMLGEEVSEESIIDWLVETDYTVRLPPVKTETVRMRMKSTEKASPHVIEPEGI